MTRRPILPYLYLLPGVVFVLIFTDYPIVQNILNSFYKWDILSNEKTFIGADNYIRLLKDPIIFLSLKNNIIFVVVSVLFQVFGGLIVAAILEDKLFSRFSAVFRTVYFIPSLVSMSVVGLLFNLIYEPAGLLNATFTALGLADYTTGWLGNPKTTIYALTAVSQWQSIGYIMMLFIVAIQKIPQDLYEAAKIEGASKIQTFFRITVPMIKEMMIVALIITVTGAFLVFNSIFIMTNGGPGHSSEVLATYLYKTAFIHGEMGYASTIANVILAITLILSVIQMRLLKTGKE